MEKDKAVQVLNNQKAKLNSISTDNCTVWQTQTKSYIKSFFGESSPEYHYIDNFQFFYHVGDNWRGEMNRNIPVASLFIDNCIETIDNNGLYKPPKPNWLTHVDNRWLVGIAAGLLAGIFFLGRFVGSTESDIKNIELRNEIKDLKKSNVSPTLIVPDKKSSQDTNKYNPNINKDTSHK
ncbi:MAG TPA: hypothetical protein VK492_06530 [Chitinophagaceae bacterium]|nr:hypothetical protein [Chitinophagaceae bacterium]